MHFRVLLQCFRPVRGTQQRFHKKNKLRDLAILTLMLGTGIRVSECVGLDLIDIDFNNDRIKVVRKVV